MELLNPEDSSTYPIKIAPVSINAKQFDFASKDLNLTFKGVPDGNFQNVEGTFEQSGMTAPLKFGRSRFEMKKPARPQTPQEPFSYPHREVVIPHIKESFKLSGTLTLPADTTKPFPIVIMASGSGPQDRDEEMLGHRPFFVLADFLAQNGIASLRFDDRGVGKSGGVFDKASLVGFSEDVESVFAFIRNDKNLGKNRVGILGHSEGAMHAWMVAKRRSDVDFIISLAGPAISGGTIIEQQQYDIGLLTNQETANWTRDLFKGVINIISSTPDTKKASKELDKFIKQHHKKASQAIQQSNPLKILQQSIPAFFNSTWGREFIQWKPEDYIPDFKGNVLYIIGDKDLQVHPELNFKSFINLTSSYPMNKVKALQFEGLNHLLQSCKKCSIEEYGQLEETISQLVLDEILAFMEGIR